MRENQTQSPDPASENDSKDMIHNQDTIEIDLENLETDMEHTADGGMATFVHWSKIIARRYAAQLDSDTTQTRLQAED